MRRASIRIGSRLFVQASGGGQGRGRTADLPLFRRTLVPTELPGPGTTVGATLTFNATPGSCRAVLTGLEPATSTLTGWRALQLLYRTLKVLPYFYFTGVSTGSDQEILARHRAGESPCRSPYGIRTRAAALKGRCPRPLDEGAEHPMPGGQPNPDLPRTSVRRGRMKHTGPGVRPPKPFHPPSSATPPRLAPERRESIVESRPPSWLRWARTNRHPAVASGR